MRSPVDITRVMWPVRLAEQPFNLRRASVPLELDEQIGVDQQGHGSPGGPALSRSARTSLAKPSSVPGAPAMSSRNRCAETTLALGGTIAATDTPLRVTSISSPAATRLRTSEKLRAACVEAEYREG